MFAHVAYAEKNRTVDILNALYAHIEREGEVKVQRYLDILSIVFRIRDDIRNDRALHILQHIGALLKNNKSFLRFFL